MYRPTEFSSSSAKSNNTFGLFPQQNTLNVKYYYHNKTLILGVKWLDGHTIYVGFYSPHIFVCIVLTLLFY